MGEQLADLDEKVGTDRGSKGTMSVAVETIANKAKTWLGERDCSEWAESERGWEDSDGSEPG